MCFNFLKPFRDLCKIYITDGKQFSRQKRENHLLELVREILENGIEHNLSVIYLFYDHYIDDAPEEIEVI